MGENNIVYIVEIRTQVTYGGKMAVKIYYQKVLK